MPSAWLSVLAKSRRHGLERAHGTGRFQVIRWLPAYLRWYLYAFATYLRRPARTVRVKAPSPPA